MYVPNRGGGRSKNMEGQVLSNVVGVKVGIGFN